MSSLHDQIMNLPVSEQAKSGLEGPPKGFYLLGHRDARHAAAELANAQDARVRRLEEALDHIVRRLQMDIDDGGRPDQWSMEDLVRKANSALKEPS